MRNARFSVYIPSLFLNNLSFAEREWWHGDPPPRNAPPPNTSAERRKRGYDIRVKAEHFAVGDWVFYHYPRRYQSRSPKWQKSYIGPYLVVRITEPVNCVLQKSAKSKPFVVYMDKLKRCYGSSLTSWLSIESTRDESS